MDRDPFFASSGGGGKRKARKAVVSNRFRSANKPKSNDNNNKQERKNSSKFGNRATATTAGRRGGGKRTLKSSARKTKKEKRKEVLGDERGIIDSDNESETAELVPEEDDTIVNETAAERRVRMAKEVIKQIEEQERDKQIDSDLLNNAVAHRLRDELDKEKGLLRRELAKSLMGKVLDKDADIITTRSHRLPVTSVAVSASKEYVVTASKDGSIIKWSMQGVKVNVWKRRTRTNPHGHNGAVLCVAIDSTDAYLATGGDDNMINIWDFNTHNHLKCFRGHRGNVNSLAFRKNSFTLFSASDDRTVKVWNTDAKTFVETLYGHQNAVLSITALHRERALSCGGRDRTIRLWKIVEESQLVYTGSGASVECIAMITEYQYVSGNQNGSLSLWDMNKKKAISTRSKAHGGNWISAVAAVPYADIFATGSCDGFVRVWAIGTKGDYKITQLCSIAEQGWINSLSFSADGTALVAAVGKEHRLGRWDVRKEGKNCGKIYSLLPSEEEGAGENDEDEDYEEDEEGGEEELEDDDEEEVEDESEEGEGEGSRSVKPQPRMIEDDEEDEEDEDEEIDEEEEFGGDYDDNTK
eukprot:m.9860 g.9860  ORF g.9860 m.9860 type:complete len:584 (+) comp6438_c0_seq4:102-1853(+)